jgi:large subunit ribosomal protein L3
MGHNNRPIQGSRAFWPRKRAERNIGHINTWPAGGNTPKIQGFAGYKAGMTHAHIVDYRPTSTTSGQEVVMPVTVVEVPPIRVAAVRAYTQTPYGLKTKTEVWAEKLDKDLAMRVNLPKKASTEGWKEIEGGCDDVRVLVHTIPDKVTGVDGKIPELMEYRIGGGDMKARIEFAKKLLGKDVDVGECLKEGDMVDAIAITTGYGFQGRIKRYGAKLLSHKNSKRRRNIGTQGPWHPNFVMSTIPQTGQHGFQQRTEYNKRVLKLGENGQEITPRGGFPHYGIVRNKYILLHGSLPGPAKRLIRFRDAVRYTAGVALEKAQISYVSTQSKQGA